MSAQTLEDALTPTLTAWLVYLRARMTAQGRTAANVFYGQAPDDVQGQAYVIADAPLEVPSPSTDGFGGSSGRSKLGYRVTLSAGCWSPTATTSAAMAADFKANSVANLSVTGFTLINLTLASQSPVADVRVGQTDYYGYVVTLVAEVRSSG